MSGIEAAPLGMMARFSPRCWINQQPPSDRRRDNQGSASGTTHQTRRELLSNTSQIFSQMPKRQQLIMGSVITPCLRCCQYIKPCLLTVLHIRQKHLRDFLPDHEATATDGRSDNQGEALAWLRYCCYAHKTDSDAHKTITDAHKTYDDAHNTTAAYKTDMLMLMLICS